MAPPKPPNRIEKAGFPVLGFAWWADPSNGRSISAYAGGGGRARSGIPNIITIEDGANDKEHISTGDEVGEICRIVQDPATTGTLWLFVSFVTKIRRYRLPSGELDSVLDLPEGDETTSLAVDAMATHLAVGTASGAVKVFRISTDEFAKAPCIQVLNDHTATVTSIDFSRRGARLITGSKDGTACVYEHDWRIVNAFRCSIDDPSSSASSAKPTKKLRPLVRHCLFLDLDGRCAVTIASAVRGKSYLARWEELQEARFECTSRTAEEQHPISAINLSLDGSWLAWGTANGSATLWSVDQWKALHRWTEVHDFNVTAIAARPYPGFPLDGEDNGLQVHVRTVSGDTSVGYLTMMRRIPKPAKTYGQHSNWTVRRFMDWIHFLVKFFVVAWIISPIVKEYDVLCRSQPDMDWAGAVKCAMDKVLVAPRDRPGISSPPY